MSASSHEIWQRYATVDCDDIVIACRLRTISHYLLTASHPETCFQTLCWCHMGTAYCAVSFSDFKNVDLILALTRNLLIFITCCSLWL